MMKNFAEIDSINNNCSVSLVGRVKMENENMDFVEMGKQNGPTVLVVYPGDWTNISGIKDLESKYHVLIPQIGVGEHTDDVASIVECIQKKCSGHVYAICVLDAGWSILQYILEQHRVSAEKTFVEGPTNAPGAFVVHSILQDAYAS